MDINIRKLASNGTCPSDNVLAVKYTSIAIIYFNCPLGNTEIVRLLASVSMQFSSTPKNCKYLLFHNILESHL